MRCRHDQTSVEDAITSSGWVVGLVCSDCGETLSQRDAGRSIDGPLAVTQ